MARATKLDWLRKQVEQHLEKWGDLPWEQQPCLLWEGCAHPYGYGRLWVRSVGHSQTAHRIAYEIANGPVPNESEICHHCDVAACFNPGHLFAGTHKDNMSDSARKGRIASGDRSGTRTHPESVPRGDRHWSRLRPERVTRGDQRKDTKIRDADVPRIRALAASGVTRTRIASLFGVSQPHISKIVNGTKRRLIASAAS